MANTFEIVGKLSIGKQTEKFVPHEIVSFPSGWSRTRLLFNVQSAENRHLLTSEGMFKEDGSAVVYTFTKGSTDPVTHEKKKGENIQVPWKDRNKEEVIDKVAEFKKFIVDVEKYGRRYKLENALTSHKNGNLSDEDLKELGVAAEDLESEFEKSKKRRKEFISEYDFTEYLYKLISSGKIDGKLFKVLGNIVYSEYNGKIYKKLVPTRIYLVDDNEKQVSTGQITLFYNKESLDSGSYDSTKKYYVNGFVREYDGQRKENVPIPVQVVIDDSNEDEKVHKKVTIIKNQFEVSDDSWKEFGVKVKLLDGAQKVEITPEMLTDFQKEMLELEAITMDEVRKEIGGDVYGDRVQEMVIVNVARGYSKGRKDTVYIDSDFVIKPIDPPANSKQDMDKNIEEDDLLADMDDIDIL